MEPNDDTEHLRSSALQTASTILQARQRAEQELIQAKQALELKTEELAHVLSVMRTTLESTTDGILVTDGSGRIRLFNEKYIEMWRMPREIMEAGEAEPLRKAAGQQFKGSTGIHRPNQRDRDVGPSGELRYFGIRRWPSFRALFETPIER